MNYLVTGAAGFIGAAIVRRLIKEGDICTTIDNLSTGYKEHIPEGCRFIYGNVSDENIYEKLRDEGSKFDAIIHIAGQSSGEVSFDNPVYDLQTNVQSTLLLLKFAQNIGCKRFVYASSMSVYGDCDLLPCSEESITVPKSFYAVGKLASENYMRIFSGFGITCTALRLFNVYGIGQNLNNLRQGMASIFLAQAISDKSIQVRGSKERFRDFVYIDDVVDAVMLSVKRVGGQFEVFNVCTNVPTTVEAVVEMIQNTLPYQISVTYSGNTPGDQFGIYGDNSKIREVLKWNPRIDFQNGMEKMIKWAETKMR
jgi:UDP-glucose 4-epimerase